MKNNDKWNILFLIIISLVVLKSFFIPGSFYTHDNKYHLVRSANYAYELQQGQFPVRMATQMGNGFSYPIFNYVYPLPYFLVFLLDIFLFNIALSHKIMIVLSVVFGVIFFYLFLRLKASKISSLAGSILYLMVPYRFLTLFVTGQLGTILAFFFVPLLLFLLQKIINKYSENHKINYKYITLLTLSFSGFILSHLISVIISLPLIFIYFLIQIFQKEKKDRKFILISFVYSLLLSIGLTGWHLIPIIFEMKYIRNLTFGTIDSCMGKKSLFVFK